MIVILSKKKGGNVQNRLCRAYSHVSRYPQAPDRKPGLGSFLV